MYRQCFPLKKVREPRKAQKRWVNYDILQVIRHKNELYAHFVKTKDLEALKEFKAYRNKLASKLKMAKEKYYINIFWCDRLKKSDLIWKKLGQLLNPNTAYRSLCSIELAGQDLSGIEMANAFNHFLIEQGRASNVNSSSIPTTLDTSPLNCSPMNSLFLRPTDYVEVFSCINSLKNSKSTDTEIQITPVKHILDLICQVMYIYNLILCSGVFPKAIYLFITKTRIRSKSITAGGGI